MTTIKSGVIYYSGNGGTVEILGSTSKVDTTGVTTQGWPYWNDVYLNPKVPVVLDVQENFDVFTSIKTESGLIVSEFSLTSNVEDGKCDLKIKNLKAGQFYRVLFDNRLVECDRGLTHGTADSLGTLELNNVVIPNE